MDLVLSGSKVHADLEITEKIPPCEIDVTQISQVINNLLINAREAMPAGGAIAVAIRNHRQPKSDNFLHKGHYISLTIKDHGPGISENDLQRIFVPYFTTKKTGSGLGLAIAYSIVNKHNGNIEVTSAKGQGAAFTIYLPASQKSVASSPRPPAVSVKPARILLMDDEEIIREVFVDMLRHTPYRVDLAVDSEETLEKFKAARLANAPYDLVFLDLTGPGDIGGIKTLEKIRALDPEASAIAISGYSVSEVFTQPDRFNFKDFLPKPFRSEDLLHIISKNLVRE